MLSGIDISNHQAPMDYGDVDFVIMKASEGKSYKDARLDQHYNNVGNRSRLARASWIEIISIGLYLQK